MYGNPSVDADERDFDRVGSTFIVQREELPFLRYLNYKEIPERPVTEVVLRAIWHWGYLRKRTIRYLTGYTREQVKKAITELLADGYIRNLGRIRKHLPSEISGEVYTLTDKNPDMIDNFYHRTRHRNDGNKNNFVTTGFHREIHPHQYLATEATAWIVNFLLDQKNYPCIPYSEQLLRKAFGWYSDKSKQPSKRFKTPVPDAWIALDCLGSLRVELQASVKTVDHIKDICENVPNGEPVCYVVLPPEYRPKNLLDHKERARKNQGGESQEEYPMTQEEKEETEKKQNSFYYRLVEAQKTIENLLVVRLYNKPDIEKMIVDFDNMTQSGKVTPLNFHPMMTSAPLAHALMGGSVARLLSGYPKFM